MSLETILDAVSRLGALGFALLAIFAFLTERIVPRARLDEQRSEKKEAIEHAHEIVAAMDALSAQVKATLDVINKRGRR